MNHECDRNEEMDQVVLQKINQIAGILQVQIEALVRRVTILESRVMTLERLSHDSEGH